MKELFRKFSNKTAIASGTAAAFVVAVLSVVIWAITGPAFNYSDTWQLVINTATTVITFLMVFLIQNTQNRDAKAVHLKLDELIRAVGHARTDLVGLEELTDEELAAIDTEFKDLREKQGTNPAIAKLHKKIAAEKERRYSLRAAGVAAGRAITSFLKTPIPGTSSTDSKTSSKSTSSSSKK